MAIVTTKQCLIGIGLQQSLGTPVGPSILLPLPEGADINDVQAYSFFPYGGGTYGIAHYSPGLEHTEGRITLPLVPGYTGSGDLADWCWDRDADGEGLYATVYRKLGTLEEWFADCKVMSGVIKCAFGGKYVSLELTINGCAAPITADPGSGAEATSLFGCRSYQWEDAAFNIASSPRTLSNDHTLNFSNEVVPPNDMTALNGSRTPIALPNDGSPNWTVEFQEIMDDEVIRNAFLNGTEAAYVMQLHAPGVAEATFTMARGIFHEHKRTIASADRPGVVKDTGIRYQALAPYTDATAACVIAENATAS